MSDCRKCSDFDWCLENEDCGLFKPKQMTNADRIRNMTDEELAKTISGDQIYPWCTEEPCKYDSCTDCVLAWLKQEAET